jgi:hypothetical protein
MDMIDGKLCCELLITSRHSLTPPNKYKDAATAPQRHLQMMSLNFASD